MGVGVGECVNVYDVDLEFVPDEGNEYPPKQGCLFNSHTYKHTHSPRRRDLGE